MPQNKFQNELQYLIDERWRAFRREATSVFTEMLPFDFPQFSKRPTIYDIEDAIVEKWRKHLSDNGFFFGEPQNGHIEVDNPARHEVPFKDNTRDVKVYILIPDELALRIMTLGYVP